MPYVDPVFYETEYMGTPIPADQFERLAKRASEQIDTLTGFEIAATGIETWPPVIAERIRKAAAAQVEFLAAAGVTETNFKKVQPQSVAIGKFNITPGAATQGANGTMYSSGMIEHLRNAGLLYAGVSVHD